MISLDSLRGYRLLAQRGWTAETAHPDHAGAGGSPAGQCGVTSAWLQQRLLDEHQLLTNYCDGTVYVGTKWTAVRHVWLTSLDGDVYDLTADQFEHPVMAYVAERQLLRTAVRREPLRDRLRIFVRNVDRAIELL